MNLVAVTGALVLSGCSSDSNGEAVQFSDAEWGVISSLSPLPEKPPPDPTNRHADDPAAAELGQKLFFERRYSGAIEVADDGMNGGLGAEGETGKAGCAACHLPGSYFADSRSNPGNVSLGVNFTTRNAPSLVNVAYYEWFGWGGKQDSLWTQASLSPESSQNSAGNRCGVARVIRDHYAAEYEDVFGTALPAALDPSAPDAYPVSCKPKKNAEAPDGAWEMMTAEDREIISTIMANSGKAIAAYERLLISRDAPFDLFVAGDETAMPVAAKRGLGLFVGKGGCVACHSGPFFSDNEFYNTGVPQEGPNVPEEDKGRYEDVNGALRHQFNSGSIYSDDRAAGARHLAGLEQTEDLLGAFRTKSLRSVAETAPYFHTGALTTLREVVEFYNRGGAESGYVGTRDPRMVPLNLTESEIDELVAFLETLTGAPIPAELTENTSAP